MIYNIRMVSDEVEDFRRDILIDSEATFLELKDIICECTGYDEKQISSFFICNDSWEKQKEITMEDMGVDMTSDIYLMSDSHLSDFIDDVGQKLLYNFDYLGDRYFYLQVKDAEYGKDLLNAECVFSRGDAPNQQSEIEDVQDIISNVSVHKLSDDFDEEFEGSSEYDKDEIEGLDEMNF